MAGPVSSRYRHDTRKTEQGATSADCALTPYVPSGLLLSQYRLCTRVTGCNHRSQLRLSPYNQCTTVSFASPNSMSLSFLQLCRCYLRRFTQWVSIGSSRVNLSRGSKVQSIVGTHQVVRKQWNGYSDLLLCLVMTIFSSPEKVDSFC